MSLNITKIFQNRRLAAVLFLSFSSGLPLSLTSSTLQAWFTQAGINIVTIGALSLAGLPYVWKFLWSPVMDRFVPPLLGRRRGWILVTQLFLCVTILILGNMNPNLESGMMGLMALVIAFISASQDIAFDAYRTDVLLPEERGVGAAITIFGFRIAVLLSGGLALILADHFGWRVTYELMAVLLASITIATFLAPEPQELPPPKNFVAALVEPFTDLFKREAIVYILLFVVFYKLGDALTGALMSNFLLSGLGFSLTDVGLAYKTIGLVATILGAFAGGVWMPRLGLYRSLLVFGLIQAFSNLTFVLLAMAGKSYIFMVFTIFADSFCGGMSTAAFVAFIMALCNHRYSATQYACLSALAAIGRVFLGPMAGMMVEHMGWTSFYAWAFLLSFPGLILLTLIRKEVVFNAEWVESNARS